MKVGNKRLTLVLIGITLSLIMMRCGGGCSGCSCMETIPGGYQEPTTENAAQARLGSSAITFLEGNLKSILASFMPEGLAFGIPESESSITVGTAYVCTGNPCNDNVNPKCTGDPPMNPVADCCLCADLQGMDLTPVSPDKLDVKAFLNLKGKIKINIKIILDNKCDVTLDVKDKPVTTSVTFRNDVPTKRMTFDVAEPVFEIDPDTDFDIKGGVLCSIANIGFIKGIIVDQMMSQFNLKEMIDDALKDMKCQPCPVGNECPVNAGAACDPADQACKVGGQCVPAPLGMEGRIDAASLLADFAPGLQAKLDMSLVTGGTNPEYVKSNGLTVRLMAGATSEQNLCVPQTTPPDPPQAGIPDLEFGAGTSAPLNKAFVCAKCDPAAPSCPPDAACDPAFKVCKKADGTCPEVDFMAGIGVHEFFIQKVLWAAFNAGVLCINIGTSSIDMLNSGVLAALLPEIKKLTEEKSRPVLLSLRPTQAPIVKIGAGTLKDDGSGKMLMVKPLLLVQLNQLSIDFYVMAFDRFTRIFTLTADVELPVGLDLAPKEGEPGTLQIVPILGDLGKGIKNTKVTNAEMLATPPETLEQAFGALIGSLLGPLLGGGLSGFDVPPICQSCDPAKPNCPAGTTCDANDEQCMKSDGSCFQSIKLQIMAIRGELPYADPPDCSDTDEAKPGCYQEFLAVYANLAMDTPNPPPPVATEAAIESVEVPPIEAFGLLGSKRQVLPRVTVRVARDVSLEYSYRLDGGLWTPYQRGPEIVVSDPILVLQGRHRLDVRARMTGRPETTDPTGVRLNFIIDAEPPELRLDRDERSVVTVKADDLVTPPERIAISYRANGAAWIAIRNGETLPPDAVAIGVEVRAADESGRESVAVIVAPLAGSQDLGAPGTASAGTGKGGGGISEVEANGCGCASVGAGDDAGLLALLAVLGAALAALRRRR
ncbi:MAG: hypothetical protein HY897_09275 [Deltaproteobacteria bacterium]|nr:hypothetical protein [Deltaproteobacteria bacterium]